VRPERYRQPRRASDDAAVRRLIDAETSFVKVMSHGASTFCRPLRHCAGVTPRCCAMLFQNVEKVSRHVCLLCAASDIFTDRFPLPSNRHHRSNGDCLEGKRGNYQVCSVQYCVQQLCTVQCTHIRTDLTVLWIGFCLTGPISLYLDSFLPRDAAMLAQSWES